MIGEFAESTGFTSFNDGPTTLFLRCIRFQTDLVVELRKVLVDLDDDVLHTGVLENSNNLDILNLVVLDLLLIFSG